MSKAWGWPASVFWAVLIYWLWTSGQVDMEKIVGILP